MFSMSAFSLDFQSARTLSLGQSGRAGALVTDTITLNPSLIGFYPIGGISGTGFRTSPTSDDSGVFNVGAMDGNNPYFGAGLSLTRRKNVDFFHLAMAKKILPWLSVGAHGKRFNSHSNSAAAQGSSFEGYDGGASFTIAPERGTLPFPVQIAVTTDNIHNAEKYKNITGGRQYSAGVKVNIFDILISYMDFVARQSHSGSYPTYSGGFEVALGAGFFARTGLFGFEDKGYGLGVGWIGPKTSLNYGYQKKSQIIAETTQALTLDFYL